MATKPPEDIVDEHTLALAKAHTLTLPRWSTTITPTSLDRRHLPRTRPLEILCLGRERTGTLSLRAALLILGYYDVYHMSTPMIENPPDCEMWTEALEGKYGGGEEKGKEGFGREEWNALLGHCAAVTDQPAAMFAEELMQAYPDAKVILTVRDGAENWVRSVQKTILSMAALMSPPHLRQPTRNPLRHLQRLLAPDFFTGSPHSKRFFDTIIDVLYGPRFPPDPRTLVQRYEQHNALVRARAVEQQTPFLEFNVKAGWEPLCAFLGKPVPRDVPFPRINDSEEHESMLRSLRWIVPVMYAGNAVKVFGAPVLAAVGMWWWFRRAR